MDLEPAVVFNEAEPLEFGHEGIDVRARGSNHLSQKFLRNPEHLYLVTVFDPKLGEKKKRADQLFFGIVEEQINYLAAEADIAFQ